MKLHIENFAKISSADVLLNGLTVIAGDNNTGKSTIGKVLYSFFRGHSNIDRRIRDERIAAVREALYRATYVRVSDEDALSVLQGRSTVQDALFAAVRQSFDEDSGDEPHADNEIARQAKAVVDIHGKKVEEAVDTARRMSDETIEWNILRRVFQCVFHGQYHPLKIDESPAKIVLTVSEQENKLTFLHDHAETSFPTKLFARARLIATPDAIGYMNVRDIESNSRYAAILEKYTLELVRELLKDRSNRSVVAEADRIETLRPILTELDGVIRGKFRVDDRGDFVLAENGNTVPTKVENLSMGLKFFALIRMMLERGVLSDRDVLILDEPENHLHPEWQVIYAKLLIRIQRVFDLTVLVTTHSQFFVNALQRFSVTEGILDKTNFYLTREDAVRPGFYTLDERGNRAGMIFKSFNRAYDLIDADSQEVHAS